MAWVLASGGPAVTAFSFCKCASVSIAIHGAMNFRLTFHLNQLARVHTIVYSGFITDVELLLLRIKGMERFDCYCDSPYIFLHLLLQLMVL